MVHFVPLMRGRQWSLDFPAKRRGWIARKPRNVDPFVMQCNLKQKTKPYHLTHFHIFFFMYGEIVLKALENITMLSAVRGTFS